MEHTVCNLGPAGTGVCINGTCQQHCCNLDDVCGAPCMCRGLEGSQSCFQGVCRCCVGGLTCPIVCDFGPLECVCEPFSATPCGDPPNQTCCPIGNICALGVCAGVPGTANLSLTKVWSGGSRPKEIVFTLRVDNFGPEQATEVVLVDFLPAEVGFVSASPGCELQTAPGIAVLCDMASINSGSYRTVDIVVMRTASSSFTNVASVEGSPIDPDGSNNTAAAKVGAGSCGDKVRIRSGPARRSFTPTAVRPSRRRAILEIANASHDSSVTVKTIEPLEGQPFAIEGTLPAVPKNVPPRKRRRFVVGMIRDAGLGPAVAKRPYFRVTLDCGGENF